MLEDGKLIDMDIADTIIERPHGFKVNQRQFYLYPVTLGKTYLISRLVECLGINLEIIKANPYMEALRICQEKKKACAVFCPIIPSIRKKNCLIMILYKKDVISSIKK